LKVLAANESTQVGALIRNSVVWKTKFPPEGLLSMTMTDNAARVLLVAGVVAMISISAYHRLRARTDERLDRRQEGWFILLTLRPLAGVLLASLVAYLIRPGSMSWSSLPLPAWVRWTGAPIGFAAVCLLLWTLHSLGRNLTDTVVTRREAALVTHGPYRWIRHPFYVAMLLAVIGTSLVAANWFLAITGVEVFALLAVRATTEERNLVARFGRDYEEYMRQTGRFLPRPGPRHG
jgi:protein-S-isoprenylcysteine O-methyltransferase Ste14